LLVAVCWHLLTVTQIAKSLGEGRKPTVKAG
jgi:hypothetical protein